MKNTKTLIVAGMAVLCSLTANAASVQFLGGETAPAAQKLALLLSGSQVVLNASSAEVLSCDAAAGTCTVTHSHYTTPPETYDYAEHLALKGSAADALFNALPAGTSANEKYFSLGFSGNYGSDQLECKKTSSGTTCVVETLYCYYPGC
jgi:hypothetical protein